MNQVSHFDTIEIWPKLRIHTNRGKKNFWHEIWIKKCSENFNDDLCQREERRRERLRRAKGMGKKRQRNVLFMPKVSKRNKFATVLYAYYCAKSFNDFLCDDIERFIQKRQDFPFDKTNKITPSTHKSTWWYFIIVTMSYNLVSVYCNMKHTVATKTNQQWQNSIYVCVCLFTEIRSTM